jgi:Uma2 family endonuclease
MHAMRAVVLRPDEAWLEERRRLGHDAFDEVWNGVLHVVPPPTYLHQDVGSALLVLLAPIAKRLGLRATYETGVFRVGAEKLDYRQPDLVVARPEHVARRGVEGPPELVVEILSEDDETYDKIPFYEAVGARELLIVDPETRALELYVRRGDRLLAALPDDEGRLRSVALGVTLATVAGPKLRVAWPGGGGEA